MRLTICILIISIQLSFAQNGEIPLGTWRSHYNLEGTNSIDEYKGILYCAGFYGGYTYDFEYNSFKPFSKIDGFNDTETRVIKYYDKYDLLMIGYNTGNIDIIKDNTIINIGDIARSTAINTKRINHIYFYGDFAYVSGEFGVSIVDLKKFEIKESITNLLALSGIQFKVFSSIVFKDTLYLATTQGLFSAPNNRTKNLLDVNSWFKFSNATGLINDFPEDLEIFKDTLLCSFGNKVGILRYENGRWKPTDWRYGIRNIVPKGNRMVFIRYEEYKNVNGQQVIDKEGSVGVYENGKTTIINSNLLHRPRDAYFDKNNIIWVADDRSGLVKFIPDADTFKLVQYKPNYPKRNVPYSLYSFQNKVVATGGGVANGNNLGIRDGFFLYDGYDWANINNNDVYQILPPIQDVCFTKKDPKANNLYFTMFGYGLLEWNMDLNKYKIYNDSNSTFVNSIPGANYTRLTHLDFDSKGDLWITNTINLGNSQNCLHVKRRDNTFETFVLDDGTYKTVNPNMIVVDKNDYKWVTSKGGIFVFDEKQNKTRFLNKIKGNGLLPNDNIRFIEKDLRGEIWVGTSEGIAVFSNPSAVFSSEEFDATKPYYNKLPLFFDQEINCIAIDAANRKWISTKEGVWLYNEDGTELILYFNSKNSPLPSSNVMYVTANHANGEVFFATDLGVISFRHNAITPQNEYRECNIFPNPVRPGYSGEIGISGLKTGSEIKIVDSRGVLLHETKSLGGMATWNARDYNGGEITTGVYFVFTTDPDGDKQMCKLAIIE